MWSVGSPHVTKALPFVNLISKVVNSCFCSSQQNDVYSLYFYKTAVFLENSVHNKTIKKLLGGKDINS